ncbi:MAG: site-specific integrase [Acidiphilium sp.]|nr:site-specific integrase [Acidiphilium sp.]MDD4937279.1 site-specific integrase [Acidiphilium sp.]
MPPAPPTPDSASDHPQEDPETTPHALPTASAIAMTPPRAATDSPETMGDQLSAWFDDLTTPTMTTSDGSLAAARQAATDYARLAKAENTRRAYRSAVRAWCAWCDHHGLPPLPASGTDVAAFLADERGRALSPETLKLRRAAIRYLHRAAGQPVPTDDVCVSDTMAGIQREAAGRGETRRKKIAATAPIIRRLITPIPDDLRGLRDTAVILVGFAGALRRSELAAIRIEHLEATTRGIRLTLPQTKGEQTQAVTVPLPYGDTGLCPVRAIERWQAAATLTSGPLFRRIWLPPQRWTTALAHEPPAMRLGTTALTAQSIALIVQHRAMIAGFGRRDLGGHSLKRGALTSGMEAGAHPARLKRLGRHKSYAMLGEYLEFGDLFEGHPLEGIL